MYIDTEMYPDRDTVMETNVQINADRQNYMRGFIAQETQVRNHRGKNVINQYLFL
jgi:hypothetical protein